MKNKIEQANSDLKIIRGSFTSQSERQLISQWLDARFYHSLGITVFLDRTQVIDAQWQLLRLNDSNEAKALLSIAVVLAGRACFWLPEESSSAGLLCSEMLKLQPCRVVTTPFGRDILRSMMGHSMSLLREYDQWVMVCTRLFPQASGRLAITSDIPRLIEYQHLYNHERSVDEIADWEVLIQQAKIAVHEVDGQIVSIVRFGLETHRLVSIGGTYTFPAYRRQGYAERVLGFAVNLIVERGRTAYLVVDTDNIPAIELYRQMGFECVCSSYVGYLAYS
ncbi:GNAT family N-acetyltransferase [Acinetobacter sp. C26M]|uniref:GNAT family N-acetyltransferase n=1 Tax=unclassified Acinetobacter TaxID=196816 RepID=UPI002036D314|nr:MULTISPECIES: GNAT family N-acetyltransferase [unclassified Acinetobacter]USA46700.1 GNAT family N-acetyltransferase [Acinetobacter sp. C26M]USA50184.1 GNAT family N-acetyltransferase [Acinetobacter sp. C26G]